jgi:hypothetical protein
VIYKFILRGGSWIKCLVPSSVYVIMKKEYEEYMLFFMSVSLILVLQIRTFLPCP